MGADLSIVMRIFVWMDSSMSSEPRKRLFRMRAVNQAADGQLSDVLHIADDEFTTRYLFSNDRKQHLKRSMDCNLENKENTSDFYSPSPKQRRLSETPPETLVAQTKDSPTSPIQIKLKRMNTKKPKWSPSNSTSSASPKVRRKAQILGDVTNFFH